MFELKEEEFYLVKDLIHRGGRARHEAISVIDRNNPGWIFVDDVSSPKSALIWSNGMEGFHLIGDEKNKYFLDNINDYINSVISPRLKGMGIFYFEFSCDENWSNQIEEMFRYREIGISNQYVYKLEKEEFERVKHIREKKDGFNILKVDRESINEKEFDNKEFFVDMLLNYWGITDNYLNKGSAYWVTNNTSIASMSYTGFISQNLHIVGVYTDEHFRRQGLAEIVVKEILNEYGIMGVDTYWDCDEENIASQKLAEKVGFVKDYEYKVYYFSL